MVLPEKRHNNPLIANKPAIDHILVKRGDEEKFLSANIILLSTNNYKNIRN
jgi:hypothetical protein